jgi:hypothetical protein
MHKHKDRHRTQLNDLGGQGWTVRSPSYLGVKNMA